MMARTRTETTKEKGQAPALTGSSRSFTTISFIHQHNPTQSTVRPTFFHRTDTTATDDDDDDCLRPVHTHGQHQSCLPRRDGLS